jgi:signal transduction histidine kinase
MVEESQQGEIRAFEHKILEAENQIEQATSKLFRLESILEEVCHQIQSLGYEFVGISLIFPERNTIEAVYGSGIAAKWSSRAKHYLEKASISRDIQADIVATQRTEVISGWDDRFDRWIYKEFNHDQVTRVFTPILLLQDEDGRLIEAWSEQCEWKRIESEFSQNTNEGIHHAFEMSLSDLPGGGERRVQIIGTIEAGYRTAHKDITSEEVNALISCVAQQALEIWKAQLPCVLEVIADQARQILGADSATLYFSYGSDQVQSQYVYEVFSGEIGRRFLDACPPRETGLGRQAILENQCKFVPDPYAGQNSMTMAQYNPEAFNAGIRSMAAFPLKVDRKEGVLYAIFKQEHQFTDEEKRWGELFARRAIDAVWHTQIFQRTQSWADQLATLHSVTQSLSRVAEDGDLMHHIAWNTLNILAADAITLYEYIKAENQFLTPPTISGRLKNAQEMDAKVFESDVPFALVNRGCNVYGQRISEEEIFAKAPFAQRESIKSVAGILLKVEEEVVGVMFINYRRLHEFSEEERQIIETLAASGAIAIKNQRWSSIFSNLDLENITAAIDQKAVLNQILQQAVTLTGADLGTIRFLDEIHQDLVTKAKYPTDETVDVVFARSSLEMGITGWVARNQQSELVNDVQQDERYRPYFSNVGSELCVPLLSKGNLLGVLNVESHRTQAFHPRHLWILKTLAALAVVAIQNVDNKEQLVKTKELANIGDLAGALVHRMNNEVGGIRLFARDLCDAQDPSTQNTAEQILAAAEQILQDAERMGNWIQEEPQRLSLLEVIQVASSRIVITPGIITEIDIPFNLPEVSVGRQQIIEVFDNLIQNAVDAVQEDGRIAVSARSWEREKQGWVEVRVCDNGVGILEKDYETVFQLGYTTKSAKRGLGFGLWWSRFYVERLRGRIEVESVRSEGTVFTVTLPAYNSGTQ